MQRREVSRIIWKFCEYLSIYYWLFDEQFDNAAFFSSRRRSTEETEKPIFKDTVNNTDGNNDLYNEEEGIFIFITYYLTTSNSIFIVFSISDDNLIQQRFAEKLAADIREVLSVHKLRKVAALTLCYKLGIPSSTRILFGLCTPVQLKRCRIKKRNIFKDKETNVIKWKWFVFNYYVIFYLHSSSVLSSFKIG